MHIGIFTLGSRGDVQPYIALALGMMKRGHTVTLAAPENFKEFVESFGVPFHPIYGNTQALINSTEGERLLKDGTKLLLLNFLNKEGHKIRHQVSESLMEGCKKVDVIVTSFISTYAIAVIAEKLNKKWAIVNVNPPLLETGEEPAMNFGYFNFPFHNRLTYRIFNMLQWSMNKKDIQEFRADLGLPPMKKPMYQLILEQKILTIHAISPHVFKRPDDWEEQYLLTGFMALPKETREINSSERVPSNLSEWIASGKKPVYIGFGSIPFPDKELFLKMLNEMISKTETRIVFCTGWFKVNDLPKHPNLFVVQTINHDWLLPQCKTAIIHGGIGTLTAVLKAEIPPIIVSIFADQPFWGHYIAKRKIGVHIPWKKVNAEKLIKAIDKCSSPEFIKNASDIGLKLKEEDGVENVINALEKYFLN